ncbi:MAG: alpha/beta fold hydrolase [Anaerolineaceae bacterium]
MKFYEFGMENEKTLMLLHGNASTWKMSFGKSIPLLTEKYHVIAVGLDGFDPTEETDYISGTDEANKIVDFICDHHNGEIFGIYGASLGCLPAILVSVSGKIKIHHLILDGAENVSFGIFNPLMTKVIAKMQGKIVKKVVSGDAKFLIKMMGMQEYTPEMLSEMIYTGASVKTLENATIAGSTFYNKGIQWIKPQIGVHVACWYGSKEGNMKKAVIGLKKIFPEIQLKEFDGYGHGELLQHPDLLRKEIDNFVNT